MNAIEKLTLGVWCEPRVYHVKPLFTPRVWVLTTNQGAEIGHVIGFSLHRFT